MGEIDSIIDFLSNSIKTHKELGQPLHERAAMDNLKKAMYLKRSMQEVIDLMN